MTKFIFSTLVRNFYTKGKFTIGYKEHIYNMCPQILASKFICYDLSYGIEKRMATRNKFYLNFYFSTFSQLCFKAK